MRNTLATATQLPSERELAQMTSVSRVTVRQAIHLLTQDGLIQQRHGAGSFILPYGNFARGKPVQTEVETLHFDRNHLNNVLLTETPRLPTNDETLFLGVQAWNRIVQFDYLCKNDDCVFGYEITIVPEQLVIPQAPQTHCVYHRLKQNGYAASRVLQNITADAARGDIARYLKLPVGNPVLHLKQTAYLDTGRPIEFTQGYYRTDRFSLLSELKVPRPAMAMVAAK